MISFILFHMELKLFQMRTVSIYTNKKSTASSRRSGNMLIKISIMLSILVKHKIHYLIKNMNIKTLC